MKILSAIAFILLTSFASRSQSDTIHLNFLYGSIPAEGYHLTEQKVFGGLKGGHVNIEVNGKVLDFSPNGNCAVLPLWKNPKGGFTIHDKLKWDTATSKWMTIKIPITHEQLQQLDSLIETYAHQTPYGYAVFGMRCAAATYDVLSEVGIFKRMSYKDNIVAHFYPKLLRKQAIRWAKVNNYDMQFHDGRNSRKWESDLGVL
jgi:hypothetical protein